MKENVNLELKGHIRVYTETHSGGIGEYLYEADNVIVTTVKSLFARLMKSSTEPAFGVWGLALGTGGPWGTPPVETAAQTALVTEVKRKILSSANFVDSNFNPLGAGNYSNIVDFQTTINATTDGLTNVTIQEMGLIGGGSTGVSNMLTAPYWNPNSPLANSVTLVNYKTLPSLILPANVNIIFSWVITF